MCLVCVCVLLCGLQRGIAWWTDRAAGCYLFATLVERIDWLVFPEVLHAAWILKKSSRLIQALCSAKIAQVRQYTKAAACLAMHHPLTMVVS